MTREQTHQSCPICQSKDLSVLPRYSIHNLVKCRHSSFVFSSKIPTNEELKEHYSNYNRGSSISGLTRTRYKELLQSFSGYRKTNRLYDIGCGSGEFLAVAKELGWEVYGSEFTQEAIDACSSKGIMVNLGVPDKQWFEEGYFDVVCSFEVIEHLSFPLDHVSFAHHLLRKGGLFYCTTPNFNAIERYILKEKYNIIEYPEHLSYFTKRTLDLAVKTSGFKKIELLSTGISPSRIKRSLRKGDQVAGNATPPISDEALRMNLESSPVKRLLKNVANNILNTLAIGNALKARYVKSVH